jgi:hypothetical protein
MKKIIEHILVLESGKRYKLIIDTNSQDSIYSFDQCELDLKKAVQALEKIEELGLDENNEYSVIARTCLAEIQGEKDTSNQAWKINAKENEYLEVVSAGQVQVTDYKPQGLEFEPQEVPSKVGFSDKEKEMIHEALAANEPQEKCKFCKHLEHLAGKCLNCMCALDSNPPKPTECEHGRTNNDTMRCELCTIDEEISITQGSQEKCDACRILTVNGHDINAKCTDHKTASVMESL